MSPGRVADLATVDGRLFVVAGDTEIREVLACLDAGKDVLLAPYGQGGVLGLYLTREGVRDDRGRSLLWLAAAGDVAKLLSKVDRFTLVGMRDAALLLIGFALGGRLSEVAGIEAEHITDAPGGNLSVFLPPSNTDPEGSDIGIAHWHAAEPIGDARCPVCALAEWVGAAEIGTGPIFRGVRRDGQRVRETALHPQEVASIVKRYARAAGLNVERLTDRDG